MDDAEIRALEHLVESGDDMAVLQLEQVLRRHGREIPWHVTVRRLARAAGVSVAEVARVLDAGRGMPAFFVARPHERRVGFVAAVAMSGWRNDGFGRVALGIASTPAVDGAEFVRDPRRYLGRVWPAIKAHARMSLVRWANTTRSRRVVRVAADEARAWCRKVTGGPA